MSDSANVLAWLEQPSGERVPINGTCSIGRLSSNSIMLPDERVSRRHVLINVQGNREFWLVDLGSGNGTYLNGRRVVQPTRLRDGDKIEIAVFQLLFREARDAAQLMPASPEKTGQEKTLQQIKSTDCWLLVADIEGSTLLMKQATESRIPMITGQWLSACKELIEDCGGSVNKFLGDGFLAYWPQDTEVEERVARALESLAGMQKADSLGFRFVLHFGNVFMGGAGSLGEESLQGKEVHFVFRMEKLAGALGQRSLISEAVKSRLPARLELIQAGCHAVAGFDGEHSFYALPVSFSSGP